MQRSSLEAPLGSWRPGESLLLASVPGAALDFPSLALWGLRGSRITVPLHLLGCAVSLCLCFGCLVSVDKEVRPSSPHVAGSWDGASWRAGAVVTLQPGPWAGVAHWSGEETRAPSHSPKVFGTLGWQWGEPLHDPWYHGCPSFPS